MAMIGLCIKEKAKTLTDKFKGRKAKIAVDILQDMEIRIRLGPTRAAVLRSLKMVPNRLYVNHTFIL